MDGITIFPPGGSPPAPSYVQLGSWIGGEALPDYGAKGLIESVESANALRDGGAFSFRHAPVRKMAFPLLINSPYGVNRLANPGFETATYSPWGLTFGASNAGTFAVVANASGAAGSYIALATTNIGSWAPLLSASITAVPTNEPMLLAAQFCDFSPSAAGESARAILRLRTNSGGVLAPDTAAPGVVFGYGLTGTPNTGNFTNMDIPNTWTRIGGIYSPQAVASLLAGGLPFQAQVFLTNIPTGGASYAVVGVDEIEWRSAYPQRAIREQESQLREFTTAGAYVSVQPEGVPTSEAVFFDILDGRWEPEYNLYENRAGRRRGTLFLDTQPFGYWPTEILLASAASVGYIGQLAVNGASVIGDVPPLAHLLVNPTVASWYTWASVNVGAAASAWQPDMLAYSFSGKPSFAPFLNPTLFQDTHGVQGPAIQLGDQYAPASTALIGRNRWPLYMTIPSALEPAYRGRFRVFGFFKLTASNGPWQLLADAARTANLVVSPAMASANQIATMYASIPSDSPNGPVSPSPAYEMLDLGEITLPPAGSGFQADTSLRLWCPTQPGSSATMLFGGFYLFPVDGAAGILTKGLVVPSTNSWTPAFVGAGLGAQGVQGAFEANARFLDSIYLTAPALGSVPLQDGRAYFRGVAPRLGASVTQLLVLTGDRSVGGLAATYPVAQANLEFAQVSVSYRPTFQFLAGL